MISQLLELGHPIGIMPIAALPLQQTVDKDDVEKLVAEGSAVLA